MAAGQRVTSRIKSFTRVPQIVRDYASLMLRWMGLGLDQRRAKKNSVRFKITKDYLEKIFPSDNLCPVFGVEFERGGQGRERDNSPSLDRIIPELGYVEGNVVWISNRANTLKRDATWEELQKVTSWLKSMTPK